MIFGRKTFRMGCMVNVICVISTMANSSFQAVPVHMNSFENRYGNFQILPT